MSINNFLTRDDKNKLAKKVWKFISTMNKYYQLKSLVPIFKANRAKYLQMISAIELEQTDQAMFDKLNLAFNLTGTPLDVATKPYNEIIALLDKDFEPVETLIKTQLVVEGYYTQDELKDICKYIPFEDL